MSKPRKREREPKGPLSPLIPPQFHGVPYVIEALLVQVEVRFRDKITGKLTQPILTRSEGWFENQWGMSVEEWLKSKGLVLKKDPPKM